MKIYTRHVLGNFLGLLVLCVASALIVFLAVDFVGNSKVWLARPAKDVQTYYLNFIPHMLYLISPVALLLAAVFSVGNMAKHLELVALRAAGISIWRILAPILLFGALASAGRLITAPPNGSPYRIACSLITFVCRPDMARQCFWGIEA